MEEENETILIGYPKIISYECTKKILEQMEKNIVKIKIGIEQGTGFFCKIPFPNKENMLPVLITNNHVISGDILFKKDETIQLDIKNEENIKTINLNNRLKYTNEDYDVTIIEIKNEDNVNHYLEIDDKVINDIINNHNQNKDFIDKTVYIMQYPEGELSVSYGNIVGIYEKEKYNFQHKCSTNRGSSGSPILNIINNKVIGIHKKGANINKGAFLSYSIKEFINRNYYMNKSNNIFEYKINEKLLNGINNKFNLDLKDIKIENCYLIEKYLGTKGNKELKDLLFYYKNKFNQRFLDLNFHQNIIEQMKKSTCKIKIYQNDGSVTGTGFFCKIPFSTKEKILPVLITASFVIDINYDNQKAISLYLEDKKICDLNLKNRYLYMNEKYKITIIEIKDNDKILDYLELDDNIISDLVNNQDNNKEFINEIVYIIQYPKGKLSLSYGVTRENYMLSYQLIHTCLTNDGSSGSPILNRNNKVLGVHFGSESTKHNLKYGVFLSYPIKEFINQYCHDNNTSKSIELKNSNKIDALIEKYNLIYKYLGVGVFKDLENIKLPDLLSRDYVDLRFNEKVIEQMRNSLFEFKIKNKKGIAFFCKIPFPTKLKLLPVLITNNQIINEDILSNNNETLEINLKIGESFKNLKLDKRIIYTNNIYGISIIEIKEEDKINSYLELDYEIFDDIFKESQRYQFLYYEKTIYMLHYLGYNISISYGIFQNIFIDPKYKFMHNCLGTGGSSGLPILNLSNKIIGIHSYNKENYNIGILIGYPIKEFIQKFYKE